MRQKATDVAEQYHKANPNLEVQVRKIEDQDEEFKNVGFEDM